MKTALGVIDVQQSLVDEGPWQAPLLLERIAQLIEKARAAEIPIVFVTDLGVEPDPRVHPALSVAPNDIRVEKAYNDAFKETTLDQELKNRGIERLVVVGLQTDYCINATCRGGAAQGYQIVLIGDAHSTNDQPDCPAERVIAQHNLALNGLTAGTGSILVESIDSFTF